MIEPIEAARILTDTIAKDIRHEHYARVVDHASMCMRFITGEGLDTDLDQVTSRETEAQFKMRKKFFFPLVPSICHRADVPFTKVHRVVGVIDKVLYEKEDSTKKQQDLTRAIDEFWGDEDMSDFMADRYRELNRSDPNAFIVTEFAPFDNKKEKAKPYPVEVSSKEAINYSKTNNSIDWMVAMFPHKYPNAKGDLMEGHRFVMYFGDVYDFRETYPQTGTTDKFDPSKEKVQIVAIANKVYECVLRRPYDVKQTKRFQGVQAGHIKDPSTRGATYISYLSYGKNRMMDTLKAGSEHSLVMALQAHPQVYMYLPSCEGETSAEGRAMPCVSGRNQQTGKTCTRCNGSGKNIPQTVLDVMVFDLPDNFSEEGVADLSKMRHMFSPDVALITAIREHLRDLEDQCIRDIFTSLQHKRGQVTATATEINVDSEAMNDSLHPYARKVSTARIALTYAVAAFVDADEGLTYTHKFPEDFRLAPVSSLLENLSAATTAGASPVVRELLEDEIVAKLLRDRPLELQKYKVQKKFRPLANLSPEDRRTALGNGELPESDKILLLYEAEVYRVLGLSVDFWYKTEDVQKKAIDKQVKVIVDEIQKEKATEIDFAAEVEKVAQQPLDE